MNRRQFLMLAMAAALAACGGADLAPPQPTALPTTIPPTQTALPHSPASSTPPAETLAPTPPPADTETAPALPEPAGPRPEGWQEFIFSEYSLLAVYYDPAVWISDKAMGQGLLVNGLIPNCQISDLPDSDPPANLDLTAIGPFAFRTARVDDSATGLRQIWLLMESGRPEVYEQSAITPIFLITAPTADADRCLEAATQILTTLHNSGVP